METKNPKLRVTVKSLNLYNRLCTVLPKETFKIDYDTFINHEVFLAECKFSGRYLVDLESTYHNLRDDEIYPYIAGKFGLKTGCRHDIIDNGTRVSECRKCQMRMELKGWDWTESPVKNAVQDTSPTIPKKSKKQEYLDNMRISYMNHGYTGDSLEKALKGAAAAYDLQKATRKAGKRASLAW